MLRFPYADRFSDWTNFRRIIPKSRVIAQIIGNINEVDGSIPLTVKFSTVHRYYGGKTEGTEEHSRCGILNIDGIFLTDLTLPLLRTSPNYSNAIPKYHGRIIDAVKEKRKL